MNSKTRSETTSHIVLSLAATFGAAATTIFSSSTPTYSGAILTGLLSTTASVLAGRVGNVLHDSMKERFKQKDWSNAVKGTSKLLVLALDEVLRERGRILGLDHETIKLASSVKAEVNAIVDFDERIELFTSSQIMQWARNEEFAEDKEMRPDWGLIFRAVNTKCEIGLTESEILQLCEGIEHDLHLAYAKLIDQDRQTGVYSLNLDHAILQITAEVLKVLHSLSFELNARSRTRIKSISRILCLKCRSN